MRLLSCTLQCSKATIAANDLNWTFSSSKSPLTYSTLLRPLLMVSSSENEGENDRKLLHSTSEFNFASWKNTVNYDYLEKKNACRMRILPFLRTQIQSRFCSQCQAFRGQPALTHRQFKKKKYLAWMEIFNFCC